MTAGAPSLQTLAPGAVPAGALLQRYTNVAGAYTDCYTVTVRRSVSLAEFVFAFYTTPVFRLERVILHYLARLPSTDTQARRVADGSTDTFAAWAVEQRTREQLLMCDVQGRTRSWFMVTPVVDGEAPATRLLFGSAIVPVRNAPRGPAIGLGYRMLLGFHRLYARVLLLSARRRLLARRSGS